MGIDFNAAVLRKAADHQPFVDSKPLRMEAVTIDPPKNHEVLVKISTVSLCRSDLSVVAGIRAWPMPIVLGHEASGIVEETGTSVTSVKPGEPVVLVFQPQCGVCPSCVSGEAHLCGPGLQANRAGELLEGGKRLHQDGEPIFHHMGLSAFAEYAVVSESSIVPLPRDIPMDIGALFGCAVMCGVGTVLNTANVSPGDTLTIVGAGGVGSSALLGAQLAGAERIVVVDKDPERLKIAKALGATDVILNEQGDAADQVMELTNGGTDFAFETAGALGAFEAAWGSVKRGGTI